LVIKFGSIPLDDKDIATPRDRPAPPAIINTAMPFRNRVRALRQKADGGFASPPTPEMPVFPGEASLQGWIWAFG